MKKVVVIIAVGLMIAKISFAQTVTPEQYIAQYKDLAIREMRRMGVPAAITLAQGLLETESGNSDLLRKSNNHFGIKCKATWTSSGVSHDDDAKGECFRVYKNAEESYRDHSNFLRGSDRYAWLFQLNPLDYKGWAYGLKKSGYATNNQYPQILINNIEQYNLQQYSMVAVNDVPKVEPGKYKDDPEVVDDTNQSAIESAKIDLSSEPDIINGCKYIFGAKGTSLLAIATKNNIDLSKLLEYNDLMQDGILAKDQIIFLQKKPKEGDKDFYIVQDNQTLYDAAQKNGIQLQSLLDYNQLTATTKVYPGTKLYLKPQVKNIAQVSVSNQNASSKQYYNVGPKEGLYSISKKYGVSIDQIKQWNNLSSDSLHVGQQLVIYQ
jgi:LysM repeat protein